jgi:hypothetical protein
VIRRCLSFVVVASLLHLACAAPALAASKGERESRFAEKVKVSISKLGTGRDALVEVRLRDKTRLTGYVSEAGADSFVVADMTTGAPTVVAYAQIKSVRGNNLSTGAKIAIGVGIVIAVAGILVLIARHDIRSRF